MPNGSYRASSFYFAIGGSGVHIVPSVRGGVWVNNRKIALGWQPNDLLRAATIARATNETLTPIVLINQNLTLLDNSMTRVRQGVTAALALEAIYVVLTIYRASCRGSRCASLHPVHGLAVKLALGPPGGPGGPHTPS
jgi:hypothetical protein